MTALQIADQPQTYDTVAKLQHVLSSDPGRMAFAALLPAGKPAPGTVLLATATKILSDVVKHLSQGGTQGGIAAPGTESDQLIALGRQFQHELDKLQQKVAALETQRDQERQEFRAQLDELLAKVFELQVKVNELQNQNKQLQHNDGILDGQIKTYLGNLRGEFKVLFSGVVKDNEEIRHALERVNKENQDLRETQHLMLQVLEKAGLEIR